MRSRRDEPVEVTEDPAASPRRAGEESEARMTQLYPPQLEEPTDPEAPATALSSLPPYLLFSMHLLPFLPQFAPLAAPFPSLFLVLTGPLPP